MRAAAVLMLALSAALARGEEKPLELEDLLNRMAEGGKRRFLYDERAVQQFRDEKVRMTAGGAEAEAPYALGLELLRTAGLAAVVLDGSGVPTFRVVTANEAEGEPMKVYAAATELPTANEFCGLSVRLKHLEPREALSPLQNMLSDPRRVSVSEAGDMLLMRDYAVSLRMAAAWLEKADAPPAEGARWRIRVAALEGTTDGDAGMPAEFREAGLEKATGRDNFRLLADGIAAFTTGAAGRRSGSGKVTLSLGGELNTDVNLTIDRDAEGAPVADPLELRTPEGFGGRHQHAFLSARVALKEGEWVIAGTVPGPAKEILVVVLVKAEKQ